MVDVGRHVDAAHDHQGQGGRGQLVHRWQVCLALVDLVGCGLDLARDAAQWLARKVMITMVAICMSPVMPAV